MVVQHVVGLVAGYAHLEELEAPSVDGADEQRAELVHHFGADELLRPLGDPMAQLCGGALRERERDDR